MAARDRLDQNLETIAALKGYVAGSVSASDVPNVEPPTTRALQGGAARAEVMRWLRYFHETLRLLDDVEPSLKTDADYVTDEEVAILLDATTLALTSLERRLAKEQSGTRLQPA